MLLCFTLNISISFAGTDKVFIKKLIDTKIDKTITDPYTKLKYTCFFCSAENDLELYFHVYSDMSKYKDKSFFNWITRKFPGFYQKGRFNFEKIDANRGLNFAVKGFMCEYSSKQQKILPKCSAINPIETIAKATMVFIKYFNEECYTIIEKKLLDIEKIIISECNNSLNKKISFIESLYNLLKKASNGVHDILNKYKDLEVYGNIMKAVNHIDELEAFVNKTLYYKDEYYRSKTFDNAKKVKNSESEDSVSLSEDEKYYIEDN